MAAVVIARGLAELGSQLWTRLRTKAPLDGTAHDAANGAAYAFGRTNSSDEAYAAALDDAGAVHVTVSKRAKSYVLHKFEKTRSWYEVHVRATAEPAGR